MGFQSFKTLDLIGVRELPYRDFRLLVPECLCDEELADLLVTPTVIEHLVTGHNHVVVLVKTEFVVLGLNNLLYYRFELGESRLKYLFPIFPDLIEIRLIPLLVLNQLDKIVSHA